VSSIGTYFNILNKYFPEIVKERMVFGFRRTPLEKCVSEDTLGGEKVKVGGGAGTPWTPLDKSNDSKKLDKDTLEDTLGHLKKEDLMEIII